MIQDNKLIHDQNVILKIFLKSYLKIELYLKRTIKSDV